MCNACTHRDMDYLASNIKWQQQIFRQTFNKVERIEWQKENENDIETPNDYTCVCVCAVRMVWLRILSVYTAVELMLIK